MNINMIWGVQFESKKYWTGPSEWTPYGQFSSIFIVIYRVFTYSRSCSIFLRLPPLARRFRTTCHASVNTAKCTMHWENLDVLFLFGVFSREKQMTTVTQTHLILNLLQASGTPQVSTNYPVPSLKLRSHLNMLMKMGASDTIQLGSWDILLGRCHVCL